MSPLEVREVSVDYGLRLRHIGLAEIARRVTAMLVKIG